MVRGHEHSLMGPGGKPGQGPGQGPAAAGYCRPSWALRFGSCSPVRRFTVHALRAVRIVCMNHHMVCADPPLPSVRLQATNRSVTLEHVVTRACGVDANLTRIIGELLQFFGQLAQEVDSRWVLQELKAPQICCRSGTCSGCCASRTM